MADKYFGFSYEIIESTRGENMAVGAWNGSDHNVIRWSRTGEDDQRFAFIPDEASGKYRILSLRPDVGVRKYLAVEPNGNAITWSDTTDGSDLFEIREYGNKVAFVESTRGEFLDVDHHSGNIQRWSGNGGEPKSNQLFELTNRKAIVSLNEEQQQFVNENRDFLSVFIQFLGGLNLSRSEAGQLRDVLEAITPEQWSVLVRELPKTQGFSSGLSASLNGGANFKDWFGGDHKKEIYAILTNVGIVVGAIAIIGLVIAVVVMIVALIVGYLFPPSAPVAGTVFAIALFVACICVAVLFFDFIFLFLILPDMERKDILGLSMHADDFKLRLNRLDGVNL